jgi:Methane oxygenase PmoA
MMRFCTKSLILLIIVLPVYPCKSTASTAQILSVRYDKQAQTISVFRNDNELLLTQHVKPTIRPYIHPIMAPDGNGTLTEFSPAHHKHQTGLYWGLKKVNGRDYFMNWQEDYWRRISARVIDQRGISVKWQTTYDLLDESGNAILTEKQTWTLQQVDGKFLLDMEWHGKAKKDVTMEKFYVGGLFLRMPWREGIDGEVINSEGNKNSDAEGKRA